jgi:glycosyltransferase involved in cell wall biosynthesis
LRRRFTLAKRGYFHEEIEPLLKANRSFVDYLGEVGGRERVDVLSNARAVVLPVQWPEPFGLVMIEAMACGTPTVAFRRGAVPEIIDDGVTGFIVDDVETAVDALDRIDRVSRRRCRETFERRFTSARMAADYLKVYDRLSMPRSALHDRLRHLPRHR